MSVMDIISGLSQSAGPAGAEGSAARLAMELLSDYAPVRQDSLGSIIAELGNRSADEHILLDAHIDEIGLVVTFIDDKGFLHIARTGGADRRVLSGAEVIVLGKRRLNGIVCSTPPHLSKPSERGAVPEWDDIYIDTGCSAERVRELVPIGARVIMRAHTTQLLGNRITGKALDDRVGVAALIRTVELLAADATRLPCRLTVLLSVQEEVGGQGAETAAFDVAPTQAIAVDVSFAAQPGAKKEKCGVLGKGPMIGISPVLDRAVTCRLTDIAHELDMPFQTEVMGGTTGTNADNISISRSGVRTGLVSIPLRNMHTAAEVADTADIEATARLLCEFVRRGGASVAQ